MNNGVRQNKVRSSNIFDDVLTMGKLIWIGISVGGVEGIGVDISKGDGVGTPALGDGVGVWISVGTSVGISVFLLEGFALGFLEGFLLHRNSNDRNMRHDNMYKNQ